MATPRKKAPKPLSWTERLLVAQSKERRVEYLTDPAVTQKRGKDRDPFASGLADNSFNGQLLAPYILLPETKYYMAKRSPTVNTILMLRMNALADFSHPPQFDGDTGFAIVPLDNKNHRMTSVEEREANRLRDFLLYTGRKESRWARDSFRTALLNLFFNTFVFDAMPIELVYDEDGRLAEWYVLDGGSIRRTDPRVYVPQTEIGKKVAPIFFVQTILDMVIAEWNQWEMIFGVRNPNPTLNQNGYGMPELESLVEMVTVEIEGITYSHRQLSQGTIPSGLLAITTQRQEEIFPEIGGETTSQGTEDFARAWRNSFGGPENAGKMAYLKLEPGEDIKFFPTPLAKDMPFMQLLEMAHNTICMTYGANPAEIPTIYGTMQSGFSVAGPKGTERRESHSEGLRRFLHAISDCALNPLLARLNPDFEIQWMGMDQVQEHDRLNYEAELVKNGMATLNEMRVTRNLPIYTDWWGDVPAIPEILTIEAKKRGIDLKGSGGEGGMPEPGKHPQSTVAHDKDGENQWS